MVKWNSMKWYFGERPFGEIFLRQNIPSAKWISVKWTLANGFRQNEWISAQQQICKFETILITEFWFVALFVILISTFSRIIKIYFWIFFLPFFLIYFLIFLFQNSYSFFWNSFSLSLRCCTFRVKLRYFCCVIFMWPCISLGSVSRYSLSFTW
jgi:hypothetical protein